jgi:hypothetical protein
VTVYRMDTRQANVLDRNFVPPAMRKVGHELLDHQCWVLGRDILNEGNNLLTEHGFALVRCPQGGLTQYELRQGLDENAHVFLWGFGAFFGSEREGIFLARSGFTPLRTQGRVELHSKENLPFAEESSNLEVLLKGIAWFAKYEDWISLRMSEQYRVIPWNNFHAGPCEDATLPIAGERLHPGSLKIRRIASVITTIRLTLPEV